MFVFFGVSFVGSVSIGDIGYNVTGRVKTFGIEGGIGSRHEKREMLASGAPIGISKIPRGKDKNEPRKMGRGAAVK